MKKLLIIGFVWPEPSSSAAGSRMMQLIKIFREEKYEIHFVSTALRTPFVPDLEKMGLITQNIEVNSTKFDEYIQKLQPHIVLFDRFMVEEQFGWRVEKFCPQALRILDTEDLHCIRKARHKAFKTGETAKKIYLTSETAKREIASILRSDLSLIISEVEMQILREDFSIDEKLLFYLPFLAEIPSADEVQNQPKFEQRQGFICIGNFRHEPNWNSVLYLKEEIWPEIRKQLPLAELKVYGSYTPKKAMALNNKKEGFLVMGRAANVKDVMEEARVCLAPLRFGAGLKGKLLDAMQFGTPSVTTPIGAEAMHGDLAWNGLIASSTSEIIDAAVQLYSDEDLWQKSRLQGYKILEKRFNSENFKTDFLRRIENIAEDPETWRSGNFIGSMLRHHLHRSTYFMARFIEEKNKKQPEVN